MYLINDVNLDDPSRGWELLRGGTNIIPGITKSVSQVTVPGYDGYFRAPSDKVAPPLILRVKSSLSSLEALLALVDSPTLTVKKSDDLTREVPAELLSALTSGEFPEDEKVYLTITLNLFGTAWRDVDSTTYGPTTVADPIQSFVVMDGLSAPVRDMDIFLSGVFDQFELEDSNGSWLKSTAAWSGSGTTGMLYVGATGQVFVANTSDPWVPVSDAGHLVDVSGGGGFKITPEIVGGNPDVRQGRLTLTTLDQTSVALTIRGKGAYAMQFGG